VVHDPVGMFPLGDSSTHTGLLLEILSPHGSGVRHSISRFPVRTTGDLRAASPQERAEALKARAAMIERSSYVFPERITARLGPAASPETIALVQHSTTTQSLCAFAELAT